MWRAHLDRVCRINDQSAHCEALREETADAMDASRRTLTTAGAGARSQWRARRRFSAMVSNTRQWPGDTTGGVAPPRNGYSPLQRDFGNPSRDFGNQTIKSVSAFSWLKQNGLSRAKLRQHRAVSAALEASFRRHEPEPLPRRRCSTASRKGSLTALVVGPGCPDRQNARRLISDPHAPEAGGSECERPLPPSGGLRQPQAPGSTAVRTRAQQATSRQ